MTLVFLLEERSMKEFLEGLLPRVLPAGVQTRLIPHEGKSDLERSIPRKLRAWRTPDTRFVVVRDQDSGDCRVVKAQLAQLCASAGRPDTLVRIACRELEAWFIGDLAAIEGACKVGGLAARGRSRRLRDPDAVGSPSEELRRLVPGYGKVSVARKMGPTIDVDGCRSPSFRAFVTGVQRLAETP